ncbi:MAG: isoamylase early set domain-containing protein [Syntrophales bacterium]|jgi:1,4-alpha-glucan branching enzyme|nr:isoamylase early set domain-containing protein [Syntrophales bacterium]MDY0044065.1 isoamylase early set domain-containing protein [Syntrophales bacterium]
MSLKKKYLGSKNVCKVTFKLQKEAAAGAHSVNIVGDFNDWDRNAHPMKRLKNGDYTVTIDLEPGRAYEFKYLVDGEKWENDWSADRYNPTQHPYIDNSVVEV